MLSGSDDLAPALLRAILDVFPVLGPLLTPFESSATANADLRLKSVFGLGGWAHGSSLIRQPLLNSCVFARFGGWNPSRSCF